MNRLPDSTPCEGRAGPTARDAVLVRRPLADRPLPQAGRQQQLLAAITSQEVLRHAEIVLIAPDILREVQPIATIAFTDRDSDDEAHAIVRAGDGSVALALTLRRDGDLQVVMSAEAAGELIDALSVARASAQPNQAHRRIAVCATATMEAVAKRSGDGCGDGDGVELVAAVGVRGGATAARVRRPWRDWCAATA